MTREVTIECQFHVGPRRRGRRVLEAGANAASNPAHGRMPRVARLMALAIHFESQVRAGTLTDYADIARLGHVTRARVTQIMNLLMLAPDIQEALLFLPQIARGREQVQLRHLLPITYELNWKKQRCMWKSLLPDL